MDNNKVASELLKIAKSLSAKDDDEFDLDVLPDAIMEQANTALTDKSSFNKMLKDWEFEGFTTTGSMSGSGKSFKGTIITNKGKKVQFEVSCKLLS